MMVWSKRATLTGNRSGSSGNKQLEASEHAPLLPHKRRELSVEPSRNPHTTIPFLPQARHRRNQVNDLWRSNPPSLAPYGRGKCCSCCFISFVTFRFIVVRITITKLITRCHSLYHLRTAHRKRRNATSQPNLDIDVQL